MISPYTNPGFTWERWLHVNQIKLGGKYLNRKGNLIQAASVLSEEFYDSILAGDVK